MWIDFDPDPGIFCCQFECSARNVGAHRRRADTRREAVRGPWALGLPVFAQPTKQRRAKRDQALPAALGVLDQYHAALRVEIVLALETPGDHVSHVGASMQSSIAFFRRFEK